MNAVKAVALLRESPVGMFGALIVLFFVLLAIFAPLVSPFDPNATILPFAFPGTAAPEGGVFLFGTDHLGRDILSRIIWGGQRVLFYATLATVSAYIVGIVMGLAAGYFRGYLDEIISFFANVILSFPIMVLYVLIIAKVGASGLNIVFAVVFASAPGIMRIVRGVTMDIATRDYIAASQTRGEGPWYIMLVEILPNARSPLIVDFCLRMGLHDHHHRSAGIPGPWAAAAGSRLGRHDHRDPRLRDGRLPPHGDPARMRGFPAGAGL